MAADIAFISQKNIFWYKNRMDIRFISARAPEVKQPLSMMCRESWSGPKFQGPGYEKYVEFANIWQYLVGNISPVW